MRIVVLMLAMLFAVPSFAVTVKEVDAEGARAWLIEDHTLPIISLQLTFKGAGSVADAKGKEGLAYLTSLLLSEGAGKYDARAFNEELDFYAIRLGVSAGRDHVNVSMDMLSEHKEKAFALLGAMLSEARFDKADIKRIKAEHLNGLKALQERPSYLVGEAFYGHGFAGHGYAHSPYGSAESITAITRDDMKGYAAKALAKDNMVMSVSGDVTDKELQALLAKNFADMPDAYQLAQAPKHHALRMADAPIHVEKPLPQTTLKIAYAGIKRDDKDFYAAYIMNHMLGGSGLAARLGQAIRQERGLTYSVGSHLAIMEHSEWLSIGFATKGDSAKEALGVAQQVVKNAGKKGFTQAELDDAISHITGEFPLNMDSNSERASYLSLMQLRNLGKDYLDKRNHFMAQVTLTQVNEVAKKLLSSDNTLIILVGEINE